MQLQRRRIPLDLQTPEPRHIARGKPTREEYYALPNTGWQRVIPRRSSAVADEENSPHAIFCLRSIVRTDGGSYHYALSIYGKRRAVKCAHHARIGGISLSLHDLSKIRVCAMVGVEDRVRDGQGKTSRMNARVWGYGFPRLATRAIMFFIKNEVFHARTLEAPRRQCF